MTGVEPGQLGSVESSTLGSVLLAFSTVTSSGLGFGTDHGVRACYIGTRVASDLELSSEVVADVYYVSLAKDGGCSCGAAQMAAFLGSDEREAIADLAGRDTANEFEMLRWLFRHAGRGAAPLTRARIAVRALVHGSRVEREAALEECEVAQRLATRLGLSEEVTLALGSCNERWDGKGGPQGLAGEAIPLAARIVNLSSVVEVSERLSGRAAALEVVRRGSGRAFDPALASAFEAAAAHDEFWDGLSDPELRLRVLEQEPSSSREAGGAELLDRFTEVLADIVDLKYPVIAGHSRRVADVALRLAARLGVAGADRIALRRAALIHDLGLTTLSAHELASGGGATDRTHPLAPGPLLRSLPALGPACDLAAMHHERVDGSGWPAGAAGDRLTLPARILATACAFDERGRGRTSEEALRMLEAEPGHDRAVIEALAAEVGVLPQARVTEWPAGLTDREVEVLRLAATGLSVREIAHRLVISHHTARHHLESTYAKIGCSSRAAATLFAAENGLLD